MKKITVATCCYDKDYQIVMRENWIKTIFSRFNYDFYEKILVVNTTATDEIKCLAKKLIESKAVDSVLYCREFSESIKVAFDIDNYNYEQKLKLFSKLRKNGLFKTLHCVYDFYFSKKGNCIKRKLLTKTYNCEGYLLGPLTALLNAKGDYLLYFTEDCAMESDNSDAKWIKDGIRLLDNNKYIAVRPGDLDLDDKWIDSYIKIENFREAYTFTDRMFLARVNRLKTINYNCRGLDNYPAYGGAGFEARIYNYMVYNDLRMLVSEDERYVHESKYYKGI